LFRKYVFSLDHKVIGLQYALTSLVFLLIGFSLAILFRWQLAYPGNLLASFFVPRGAPDSGWTSYPPLADVATVDQTFWLVGMFLLIISADAPRARERG